VPGELGLNATQGALLGFLYDEPLTGWDLLRRVRGGLSRFWNMTTSHVYRELRSLEDRGLVRAGPAGARDKRPFTITPTGRAAFRTWIREPPGPEQIRYPLLVRLWFARHVDPETLAGFIAAERLDHAQRLDLYQGIDTPDRHTAAVVGFGIAYERAVLGWLAELESSLRDPAASGQRLPVGPEAEQGPGGPRPAGPARARSPGRGSGRRPSRAPRSR
jgi:DNA-binding PadR family transcriptional regulator